MVSLAFAIAASANFPVLFMSMFWKDCTTRGAVVGGFLGLITSVLLTVLSPSVWEATLGNAVGSAIFPYTSPALFSMPLAFLAIWLVSIMDNSARAQIDRAGFHAQQVRSETGIGASQASPTDARSRIMPGTDAAPPHLTTARPSPGGPLPPDRERREFISLMTARVRDAPLRKPFYVDGATRPRQPSAGSSRENGRTGALVRDGDRLGIFTTTDLRDALLLGRPPERVTVREVAIFEPLSVSADDEMFEALILMLRHGFHRVIVREGPEPGSEIAGVLDPARPVASSPTTRTLDRARGEQARDRCGTRAQPRGRSRT